MLTGPRRIRYMPAVVILALLLAACGSRAPATPAPAPTLPPPTDWSLPPGGTVEWPVPGAGPTVETPCITLEIEVLDIQTRQQVHAAQISLDGRPISRGCCCTVAIEATAPHTLTVTAPGYRPWATTIAPRNLKHNVTMKAPIWLQPVMPEARNTGARRQASI